MLTPKEAGRLLASYGEMVSKVSQEVYREFRWGRARWAVVEADDIEQEVLRNLIEKGHGVEFLDELNEPQGWLRTTARHWAMDETRKRRSHYRTDFSEEFWEQGPTDCPEVENEVLDSMVDAEVRQVLGTVASTLLSGIRNDREREAARLFYLDGLDIAAIARRWGTKEGAAKMALSRARKAVGSEGAKALEVIRAYHHPDAKRPPAIDTLPAPLLDALAGVINKAS